MFKNCGLKKVLFWDFKFFLIFFAFLVFCYGFLEFFWDFFLPCFKIIFKVAKLLLKITKVTTEHQKWPKIRISSVKSFFFSLKDKKTSAEGRSPPQELEVSPQSRLYFLVKGNSKFFTSCISFHLLFTTYWGGKLISQAN